MKTDFILAISVVALSLYAADASVEVTSARRKTHGRIQALDPLIADLDSDTVPPAALQKEVEQMESRANKLSDATEAAEFDAELEGVEVVLAKRAERDAKLENEITVNRVNLCAKQGFLMHQADDCDTFMRRSCGVTQHKPKPTPKDEMDEDFAEDDSFLAIKSASKKPVSMALCKQYFHEEAETEASVDEAAAPAPAPAGAPGPAAPGGPQPSGLSAKSFKGWFKNMSEKTPLYEQGFEGKRVAHNDGKTVAGDWGQEFGPSSGARSAKEICSEFRNNEWCRLHGYYDRPQPNPVEGFPWSGASGSGMGLVTAAAVVLALARN